MAKQFYTTGEGSSQTLSQINNETIKIYATESALDNDLANLEENEIVATDEGNNSAPGTQYPVDIVQDGNMHAVTSNAVAGAIASLEPQQKSLNIDTLYPSEDGKIESYFGNFSGNVPENRNAATLKVIRVKMSNSDEVQLYQEWECYSDSSTNLAPNKYFRYGYFTGSNIPTWTSWQKVIRNSDLTNYITIVNSDSVTDTFMANQEKSVTIHITIPNGYKAVCWCGLNTSGPGGLVNWYSWSANNIVNKTGSVTVGVYFRNYSSSSQNVTIILNCLCVKIL